MTLAACAEITRRGDPDRFLAAMAAPPEARARLLPLYAFNVEVARAPWLTEEPMVAEMRLQWWRDTLAEIGEGKPPRAHEVAVPLAGVLRAAEIAPALLDDLVEARRWDIYREPFADAGALCAHLDRTGGTLMWAAARALGAPAASEPAVRNIGRAGALAAWLVAVPVLAAKGRAPLPDEAPEAVRALARDGLGWIAAARADRASVPRKVVPALLPAWQAVPVLRRAVRAPELVAAGLLGRSEFARRGGLLWQATTGRW